MDHTNLFLRGPPDKIPDLDELGSAGAISQAVRLRRPFLGWALAPHHVWDARAVRERHESHSETTGSAKFAAKNAHQGAKKKAASEWRKLKATEGGIDLFDVQISTFIYIQT